MRIITSKVGFAFTFDNDKERDEFLKTVSEKKDPKGFFFLLDSNTHKAEADKCRKTFAQALENMDDLVTISGSRRNLECIFRTIKSIGNYKPEDLDEQDFKIAIESIKIICRK